MLVLAAVPDLQYQRLRTAVAPRFAVVRAATWDLALQTIREQPVEHCHRRNCACGRARSPARAVLFSLQRTRCGFVQVRLMANLHRPEFEEDRGDHARG